jgi:hypothetical protein
MNLIRLSSEFFKDAVSAGIEKNRVTLDYTFLFRNNGSAFVGQ